MTNFLLFFSIIETLINKPKEKKFRNINAGHPQFFNEILSNEILVESLIWVGFNEKINQKGTLWSWESNKSNWNRLKSLHLFLKDNLKNLDNDLIKSFINNPSHSWFEEFIQDKSLDEINESLDCPICFDKFKNPYELVCGHNFCKECMDQYIFKDGIYKCPLRCEPHSKLIKPSTKFSEIIKRCTVYIEDEELYQKNPNLCPDFSCIGNEIHSSTDSLNLKKDEESSISQSLFYEFPKEKSNRFKEISSYSSSDEILKLIECPVCNNFYDDPQILKCEHSFCKKCIPFLKNKEQYQCKVCSSLSDSTISDTELKAFVSRATEFVTKNTSRTNTSHDSFSKILNKLDQQTVLNFIQPQDYTFLREIKNSIEDDYNVKLIIPMENESKNVIIVSENPNATFVAIEVIKQKILDKYTTYYANITDIPSRYFDDIKNSFQLNQIIEITKVKVSFVSLENKMQVSGTSEDQVLNAVQFIYASWEDYRSSLKNDTLVQRFVNLPHNHGLSNFISDQSMPKSISNDSISQSVSRSSISNSNSQRFQSSIDSQISNPNSLRRVPQVYGFSNNYTNSRALPPGWEQRVDPKTRRPYYVDHNTKTTQWDPPSMRSYHSAASTSNPNITRSIDPNDGQASQQNQECIIS